MKNVISEASSRLKYVAAPTKNVKNPHSNKKITRNTYASGLEKYAPSSRFVIVLIFAKVFIAFPPSPYRAW
jgi:hypothetical protein